MNITLTGIFSGFRVANFSYTPIGVKYPVGLPKMVLLRLVYIGYFSKAVHPSGNTLTAL
jgi:hypothetical protein